MIIRSAFWLCVGFALVAPHGVDFGAAAGQARDRAIETGTQAVAQLIADQTLNTDAVKTIAAKLAPPAPSVRPAHAAPAPSFVFPRMRPAALG